ncbi:MAG: 6,7-dimethyl-8-ribityllumazine synthase [Actinomycetota bacterium]
MTVFEGSPDGADRRIAIVAARFNGSVSPKLVDGALAGLAAHGVSETDVDVVWVPGAFEIPLVAGRVAHSGRYDGIICLGAVIRGETAHFDLVANEAARGIADAARESGIPVIFEVLAVDTLALAEDRAGGAHGNKGWEAAEAVLSMASLLEALSGAETASGARGVAR